jgi:predicted short-subunit dehydrogenase-like oxidoreductase (DUF2520 family)
MPASRLPNVSIIGAGTVGSTIAGALSAKGYRIVSVISRTGHDAIALAKIVKGKKASTQVSDIDSATQIIIIAVTDDAIAEVAKELSKLKHLRFKKIFAAHLSGVHSSDALEPLQRKGALVASLHPIQTFPKVIKPSQGITKLRGIYYGIEGEPNAIVYAERIVKDLEGKSVVIPQELKPLYHVACVFASNYMMIYLNTISELTKLLKLNASWTEVFGPLMTTTMENIIKHSAGASLTGPIIRNDTSTIEQHLTSLSRFAPQFLPLYTVSGIELARVAKQHGRIKQGDFDSLISLFKNFIKTTSTLQRKVIR